MPPADLLIPFFVASALLACIPGPGMVYAVAQTVASGRRSGWYAAAGFHLAGLGHIAAAAFGVSMILQVTPILFVAMKMAGAAYLIWVGISYLVRRVSPIPTQKSVSTAGARKALKDSIVVEVLNPKSAIFFLAFLPQFTDATAGLPIWAQIVVLGLVVNVMFTVTDAILIELSHAAMRRLTASERIALLFQRVGGGILVALGVNVAFSR